MLEKMIRQAQGVLPEVAEQWEIIPVNDGSKDKTGEIINRLAAEDPHVRPVHHERKQGIRGSGHLRIQGLPVRLCVSRTGIFNSTCGKSPF